MNSSSLSSQKTYSCFLKLKQNWPDRISLNLHSFQSLDSMWALSSASGRGRWDWVAWTLTSEPGGHMSLEAIFEAQNYTWQLGGLHLKQQWAYRVVLKVFLRGLKLYSTKMCHGPDVPTHPPSARHNRLLLLHRDHIFSWFEDWNTEMSH